MAKFPLSLGATLDSAADGLAAQTCADHLSPSRLVGGRVRWETVARDGEIRFAAPVSIVHLFRSALRAHARPGEPRWRALERLLATTVAEWESAPRHHDPVFARDGWRCAVPACSSRGPFHDHHIEFRSRGGGNARSNRTAVCVAHHLHAIHAGVVRAWGIAPDEIHWQLGVHADHLPLMELVGDFYVSDEGAVFDRTA